MRPLKGMRRDERPTNQPEDSWRRAKNMLYNKGFKSLSNEPGFVIDIKFVNGIAQSALNKEIIGVINTGKESVLFSCEAGGAGLGSEIGVLTNGNYKTVIADDLLNFSINRPIEGIFKINFNGQIIVVWWEGTSIQANPIRLLNLNAIPFSLTGFALTNPADIGLLELFPPAKYPVISDITVDDGGSLLTATYYPIFNYEFPDGNSVGWTIPYNPVHVFDDSNSNGYNETDGAPAGSASPKRISMVVSNIDVSFFNIQVGYVKVQGGVVTAQRVNSIRITSDTMTIAIDGSETIDTIPIEDVIIPRVSYPFAKAGTQLEDRLYIGNLRSRSSYDYQKYANNIKINWTTGDWLGVGSWATNNVVNKGSYKEQKFTFFDKGFQADEVYAYYIAFINKDMTLSEAYHIPGRAPLSDGKEYDLAGIASVPTVDAEQLSISGVNGKKFQFDNTADRTGRMGFWENEIEKYTPVTLTNIDSQVWNSAGAVIDDLSNKKVRHHKFPSLEYLIKWGYSFNKNVMLTPPVYGNPAGSFTEQIKNRSDNINPADDVLNLDNNFGGGHSNAIYSVSALLQKEEGYFVKVDDAAGSQRWRFQFSQSAPARDLNNTLENFNRSFNSFCIDEDSGTIGGVPNTKTEVFNARIKFGYDQKVRMDYLPRFRFAVDGGASTISYKWEHRRRDNTLVNFYIASTLTTPAATLANYNDAGAPLNLTADVLKDDYFLLFIDITSTTAPVGSNLTAGTAPRYNSGVYEPNSLFIETVSDVIYPIENTARSFIQPLGIDVSDIFVPQEIADNVQGFVIMYAKRGSNNISILGQSTLLNQDWHDPIANTASARWNIARTYDFIQLKHKTPNVPSYFKSEMLIGTDLYDTPATFTQSKFHEGVGYDVDKAASTRNQVVSYNHANITQHPRGIIRRVKSFAYVPENVIISTPVALDNVSREEFALVKFATPFDGNELVTLYNYPGAAPQPRFGVSTNYFGNLKSYKQEVYSSYKYQELVNTGQFVPVTVAGIYSSLNTFGGDIFRTAHGTQINHDAAATGEDSVIFNVVESPAHISLRHAITPKEYYPHGLVTGSPISTSYYDYNDDYSRINDLFAITIHDSRFPKPTVFPTRIARSIVSRNEEYKISWNRFIASDYYEMPKDKGVIWKLDVANRSLMINLEFAFYVAKNKDKLALNAGEVYTGTGDIFDRLPDEQIPIKGGYAGCQSQWAAFVSKMGYFFVDKKQGKMFMYNGKLIELSDQGLRHELFERLRDSNSVDNPFTGSGLTAGFDSEHNRLLVCKAGYIFNNVTKLNDPDNFTLSYSFDIDAWISNHDYYPNFIFNNREVLLSVRNTAGSIALPSGKGEIYQHNVGPNGIYYGGIRSSSYVDVVFNSREKLQQILDSIEWLSDVEDTGFKAVYRDKTFTHLMVYNNNQCSNIIDLRNNPSWFTKPSRNNEGVWSAGGDFRDVLVAPNTPILDKDGEVYSNVLDTAPAWFNQNLFLETFGIVRFIYYNADGFTIYLNEANAKFTRSAR